MHIVIDGRIINSSTGRYIERLITYLEKIDTINQYTILVRSKDIDFWIPSAKNFKVIAADFANYSLSEQIGFKKLLETLQPDLVHFCMPQQPVLYRGKVVTTIHDLTLLKTWNSDKQWLVYHLKQAIGRLVFHKVIQKSLHIITDSHFSKDDIERFDTRVFGKISVIYLAADINNNTLKKYDSPYSDYLLYVGTYSDYKNIKRLGDAHQLLLQSNPKLGLILVGRSNKLTEKTKRYFDQKGYKNIHFTGFISDEERDWLYKNCSAYVFPSLMEGFGLPGLEAMLYGAPVVASNTTSIPEILGEAAEYFDPLNTSNMADVIRKVITDNKLRKKMKTNGFIQVKKYSWQRAASETHAIYMKALAED